MGGQMARVSAECGVRSAEWGMLLGHSLPIPHSPLRTPHSALYCPCVGSNSRPLATRKGVSLMKILALEFSSSQRSVAVVQPGRAEEVIEAGSQGPNALGMIAVALRASGLEREQIECLAIGL